MHVHKNRSQGFLVHFSAIICCAENESCLEEMVYTVVTNLGGWFPLTRYILTVKHSILVTS